MIVVAIILLEDNVQTFVSRRLGPAFSFEAKLGVTTSYYMEGDSSLIVTRGGLQ